VTPAQAALKNYLFEKLGEGVFIGKTSPGDIIRKASAEFAADLPVALSDLLSMMGDNAVTMLGRIALGKIGDIARDVSKRGIRVVATEVRDSVDMQYQRGVERNRKNGK